MKPVDHPSIPTSGACILEGTTSKYITQGSPCSNPFFHTAEHSSSSLVAGRLHQLSVMLAKALVIFFSVVIILATIIASLLATATPTSGLHSALLTITPSTALHTVQSESVDGPSLLIGLLSSCARINNAAPFMCTRTRLSPQYALSILGGNVVNQALQRPPAFLFVATGSAVGFQVIFFVMFLSSAFAGELGLKATLGKPSVVDFTTFVGLMGSLGGAMCFGILRLYFGKLCQDFNDMIQFQGAPGPNLVASVGQGFTMVWALYPLLGVVILLSFLKNHIRASEDSSGISDPPPKPPTDTAAHAQQMPSPQTWSEAVRALNLEALLSHLLNTRRPAGKEKTVT